jgi:hypothetical protein
MAVSFRPSFYGAPRAVGVHPNISFSGNEEAQAKRTLTDYMGNLLKHRPEDIKPAVKTTSDRFFPNEWQHSPHTPPVIWKTAFNRMDNPRPFKPLAVKGLGDISEAKFVIDPRDNCVRFFISGWPYDMQGQPVLRPQGGGHGQSAADNTVSNWQIEMTKKGVEVCKVSDNWEDFAPVSFKAVLDLLKLVNYSFT